MNRMAATIYLNHKKTVYKIGSSDYAISCAPLALPGPHLAKHQKMCCGNSCAQWDGLSLRGRDHRDLHHKLSHTSITRQPLFPTFMFVEVDRILDSHFPFCHVTSQPLGMTMLRLKGCTNCWIRCCRVWAGHLVALLLEAISTLVSEACNLVMTCTPWAGGSWSQERPWRAFSKLGCAEWVSHFEPANKCA